MDKYLYHKTKQLGINNPNYKHGKYIENRCSICNIIISPKATKCRKCYFMNRIGNKNFNYKDGRTLKKYYCIKCNKPITVSSGQYGSGKCKSCALRENKKYYYCIDCSNKINYNTFYYGNKRCQSCNGKRHSKQMKGNKNPNWIDGRSFKDYPLEFNKNLKAKIRARDDYQCQNCEMTEEEHLIVYGRVLDVHHIDYNKNNCNKINLISLCQGCNLRANWNRDYWQEYYLNKLGVINGR